MSEEINTHTNEDYTDEAEAAKRLLNPNYKRRRAVVGAGVALTIAATGYGVGEGVEHAVEANKMEPVAVEIFTLQNGDSIIGAAETEAEKFFTTNNLDLTAIPYSQITYEAQQAADKNVELTGETQAQPGDSFVMLFEANDNGNFDIHISPSETSPTSLEPAPAPEPGAPTPDSPGGA